VDIWIGMELTKFERKIINEYMEVYILVNNIDLNMPIISVSLSEKNVEDLESLQKDLGFGGRSEAIRAAMRTLLAETSERRSMVGQVDGVLIMVNDACASVSIHDIYHDNHPLIKTHVHNHLGNHKCMNMMVLSGEAAEINELLDQMYRLEGIAYLKFIRS